MHRSVPRFSVGLLLAIASASPVAAADEPAALPSLIREVTVYADRARVMRSAVVHVAEGASTVHFAELPGWIDESSVRIALGDMANVRVADVRTRTTHLARSSDVALRDAEDAATRLRDALAALEDEERVLTVQAKHAETVQAFALEKAPRDAALRPIGAADYQAELDFVTKVLRATAEARRTLQVQRRKLQPDLAAAERTLCELQARQQLDQTTVQVDLVATAAADGVIEITYMLPGATWTPAHELRADGAAATNVTLASYAVATQTTGEDWTNARFAFSTQSPDSVARIPALEALSIGALADNTHQVMAARASSFSKAKDAYALSNGVWYNYLNPKDDQQLYGDNVRRLQTEQDRNASTFKQILRRGTTAQFAALGSPTVRTDGKPVRVKLVEQRLSALLRFVAAPQASLNAVRAADLTHAGTEPLLPGPVALFSEGAYLGQTEIPFVSSGESFSVFLGVADHVKLSRVLDRKASQFERGRRNRMSVAFDIVAENLGTEPVTVELTDRIPVSDKSEIEIDSVRVSPRVAPDKNGLLLWKLAIPAGGKTPLRVAYTVEYPATLMLTPPVARQQRDAVMEAVQGNAPAASAAEAGDANVQILSDLEQMF
jgi:uncharacterized protein (TIGR02231 family)